MKSQELIGNHRNKYVYIYIYNSPLKGIGVRECMYVYIYIYICEFLFNVGLAGAASAVGIREVGEFTFVGACQHQDGATKTTPQPTPPQVAKTKPNPSPHPQAGRQQIFQKSDQSRFCYKIKYTGGGRVRCSSRPNFYISFCNLSPSVPFDISGVPICTPVPEGITQTRPPVYGRKSD